MNQSTAPIPAAGRAQAVEAAAADWLARSLNEAWSAGDQEELDAWLASATAHRVAYLRLRAVWQRSARLGAIAGELNKEAAPPAKLPGLLARVPDLFRGATAWRLAASVLLVASVGFGARAYLDGAAADAVHVAGIGQRKPIDLPDGSHVLLNTDSRLLAHVDQHRRSIRLERGEAYFEVAHDPARPFVVEAGRHRVTVLGTRFSVRLDGALVHVKVVEGRVRLEADKAPAHQALLTRNEVAVADDSQVIVAQRTDKQLQDQLSWRQGRLVLDGMTLAEAAEEFNRYNRQQLRIDDAAVAQMRIGGGFAVENVQDFASLLRKGFGLKVRVTPDTIVITG